MVAPLDAVPDDYEPDYLQRSAELEPRGGEALPKEDDAFVLVVSAEDDPVASEVDALIATLSVPVRAAEIDVQVSQVISPSVSTALRSARGCIFIWPESQRIEEQRQLLTRIWMTVGAASFQLGERVLVVADVTDQPDLGEAAESLDIMIIDRNADGGLFRELMSAMVQTSIVQISFG